MYCRRTYRSSTIPAIFSHQMPITIASKVYPLINIDHMSFHGCVSGPEAVSRLKEAKADCYLVRYSDNQSKYLVSVLKKGLGEDRDKDLVKDFEIQIINGGKKCKINGLKKAFKTLDDMLSYYETVPIHPSVASLGDCCPSPRHQQKARCGLTESRISNMTPTETLMRFNQQREEMEKRLNDLQKSVEKIKSPCTIL